MPVDAKSIGLRFMKAGEPAIFSKWEADERPYPWTQPLCENALSDESRLVVLVAGDESDKAIGFAAVQIVEDEAYLSNLMIHPSFRRNGRATEFLQKIMI